jgi:putative ABC transport system substrate-binding protein
MQFDHLKRRDFITLLAALVGPHVALAQQTGPMRRIGMLMMYDENDAKGQAFAAAFRESLAKLGWTEGNNLELDCWATSDPQTIQRFAAELVGRRPDLILSSSAVTTASLLAQTRTIPVIFGNLIDPVGSGFVSSRRGRVAT